MNQLRPRPLVLIVDDELSARLIMPPPSRSRVSMSSRPPAWRRPDSSLKPSSPIC